MVSLKKFLTQLAKNPQMLGKFIHNPEKTMKTAGLGKDDQAAIRSGSAAIINARLAGLSMEEAFKALSTKTSHFEVFITGPKYLLPLLFSGKLSSPTKVKSKSKTKPKGKK